MKAYIGISFILLVVLHVSCERLTQPRVENQAEVHLTEVATLVQDTYLRLQVSGAPAGSVLRVYRNNTVWIDHPYTEKDSLLHDSGLPPGSQLTYRAEIIQSGVVIGRSAPLSVQLLDTTSHQVQWEVYEFNSPYGSGNLSDVAIVSEDNIWVVGEIYNDSVKTWLPYNAIHWDGIEWKEFRIKTKACGGVDFPGIRRVKKMLDDVVVFAHIDASLTFLFKGQFENSCKYIQTINSSIWNLWGMNRNFLIIGSEDGILSKYDGYEWYKIYTSTRNYVIQDIYGYIVNNELNEILAIASDFYHRPGSELIRIDGDAARIIADSTELQRGLAGIWFSSGREYWLVGDGVFRARLQPHNWEHIQSFPAYFAHGIGGTDVNDIWVVGAFGLMSHFNGKSWHHYRGNELPPYGVFWNVQVTKNLIVAVGVKGGKGYVVLGKR